VIDDKPAPRKRRKNTQSGKEKVAHEVCWWELKRGMAEVNEGKGCWLLLKIVN